MSDNIRGEFWLEASDYIAKANERNMADPQFWAFTLSALVNAIMAAAPDSVMDEVAVLKGRRARQQRKVQRGIKKDLQG